MPCRSDGPPLGYYDDHISVAERDKLRKMADKLQADLCKLGEYMADLIAGKITLEEVKTNPEIIKLMASHVKHRRKDRDRHMDALTKRLKAAKTTTTVDKLASELRDVALMSDNDLLTTELF